MANVNELHTAYSNDTRFRQYVDKYCWKYPGKITVNEALTHELVWQVYLSFQEEKKEKMIDYCGFMVPKELCTISKFGETNDCATCGEYCKNIQGDCTKCAIQKCFEQLTEYLEIGLTTEQIHEIDKLYAEKCKEVAALNKELEELRLRKYKKKSMLKCWWKRKDKDESNI